MHIDKYEIVSRKQKKNKSGLERFDHSLANFEYEKKGSISDDALVLSKTIALYCFDFNKNCAVFLEVEDAVALGRSAFFSDYQYENATNLYLVSMDLFKILAEKIASLRTEFILVGFTARSGSTLLCKAVSRAKNVFGVTEPFSIINIGQRYKMSGESGKNLLKNSLLFYSNLSANNGADLTLLKPHPTVLSVFSEIFPDSFKHNLFITREAEPVVKSLVQRLPLFQRVLFTMIIGAVFKKRLLQILPIEAQQSFDKQYNKVGVYNVVAFIWWVFPFEEMAKIISKYPERCLSYSYAEFTKDPRETMVKIFDFCGISHQYLNDAIEEFDKDSQRGTVLSQSKKIKLFKLEYKKIEREVREFVRGNAAILQH